MNSNGDGIQSRALTIINRQVNQLTRLVNDLMDVARVSSRLRLDRDYGDAWRGVTRRNDPSPHRPAPPDVEGVHSAVRVWVHANALRLEQIVVNLLVNAAGCTEPGGDILLTLGQDDGHCRLRIRDSGVGISSDLLPCTFDLFTQAELSLAHSKGGWGIWLALGT